MNPVYVVTDDMERGWPRLLEAAQRGRRIESRGFLAWEVGPVMLTLTDPTRAVVCDQGRRLNHAFSAAEFCWVIAGRDDVEPIAFFNSKLREFSDDGQRFFGAYGPPIVEQLPWVLGNLRAPDSRQAVLTIWRPQPPPTKDVPCTVSLHFMLRDGALSLIVYMRSNDLWLGMPYDVPLFCRVQAFVASLLDVPAGTYHHVVGSLHAYDRDADSVEAVLSCASPRAPRPRELEVGPFDTLRGPAYVWRQVEGIVDGRAPERCGRGWDELLGLMRAYAERKRLRAESRPGDG